MGMKRATVGALLSRARLKFKEAFRMSSIDTENLAKECHNMLPLLSAYMDDELDRAERERVESHVGACAFCRPGSASTGSPATPAATTGAIAPAGAPAAPADVFASDLTGTGEAKSKQGGIVSRVVVGAIVTAAIVLFAVSIAGGTAALRAYQATSTAPTSTASPATEPPATEPSATAPPTTTTIRLY